MKRIWIGRVISALPVPILLLSGVLKLAKIEKTVDGKDYKIVFKKAAAPEIEWSAVDELPPPVV